MEQAHSEPYIVKNVGIRVEATVNENSSVNSIVINFGSKCHLPEGDSVLNLETLIGFEPFAPS